MATRILGDLIYRVRGDTRDFDKNVKKTTQETKKLGEGASKVQKALIAAFTGAALIAGFKKLIGFLGSASDAAAVQESAIVRLGAALEATGQSGNNALGDLQSFASSLQAITVVGDETTLALLQTATNMGLTTDEAKTATEQAIGLSRAYGIDLNTALLGVANTMKGQTSTLTRYIPSLKLAGDETERLAILNEEAARAMAIATAETETAAGTQAQLSNALGDTNELIGAMVNERLTPWRSRLKDIVTELNNARTAQVNLDKAIAGEADADVVAALTLQREKIQELEDGINEGGTAALRLARHYQMHINDLDELLAREKLLLASMSRRAGEAEVSAMRAQEDADAAIAADEQRESYAASRIADAEEYLRINGALTDQLFAQQELEEENAERERSASERIRAFYEYRQSLIDAERAAEEQRHQDRLSNIMAELNAYSGYAGNVGTIFSNLINAQMAGEDELTDRKKKSIIALYRLQQAANIAQIAMDTAAGIVAAWKSPGFPLAIPISILIGAIGLTNAAVVASTPPPVALAEGAVIEPSPGGTQFIAGEAGEAEIVTSERRMREFMQGAMGGGNGTANIYVDGEFFGRLVQNMLNTNQVTVPSGAIE